MNKVTTWIIFLALNYGSLFIGSLFANPAEDAIYQSLNRAPWTPPGWVFGAAWFTIMLCFTFFMNALYSAALKKQPLLLAFGLQWLLNVSWNPIFFGMHWHLFGLIVLLLLLGALLVLAALSLKVKTTLFFWILPYVIWMCIAISLNAYVVWNN